METLAPAVDGIAPSSELPRVLMLTNVFPPDLGGAGVVPKSIAAEFPQQITVITTQGTERNHDISDWAAYDARFAFRVIRAQSFVRKLNLPPGKVRGLLSRLLNGLWVRPEARRLVRRSLKNQAFDVICLNTVGSTHFLVPDLLRLNPRAAVVCHAHGEEWGGMLSRGSRGMFAAYSAADAIVAVSSFAVAQATATGISRDRITLVNNGVDTRRFSPGPAQPELLERWGVTGRPTILCLARFDERKGQDMLLRSMPLILAEVPDAVLLLVGSGEDEQRLRAIVAELKLHNAVVFTGPASDAEVVGWYRTADFYIMPNRTTDDGDTEGFGLVFLEAAACGLPVIAGRAGGAPDAVAEGINGFLVDGRSPADIAAACLRLLKDPELRATLGRNGQEFAASKSWTRQAAGFMRAYAAAAAKKSNPA